MVDIVLLWWREEDGDLFEGLTDAMIPLTGGGNIWLLTPKARTGTWSRATSARPRRPPTLADQQCQRRQGVVRHPAGRAQGPRVAAGTVGDLAYNAGDVSVDGADVDGVNVDRVNVGDEAPDFELRDQHGTPVRLSDLRGEKKVVLVFYPLAFSGVCTGELTKLRDGFRDAGDDVLLLAVSVDSMFALRAWSDQEKFWFPCCRTSGRTAGRRSDTAFSTRRRGWRCAAPSSSTPRAWSGGGS